MRNYYDLLEIPRTASPRDIQLAFRKLATRYHPDKNPGDPKAEEQFKLINTAYQVLSDPVKRNRYDTLIAYGAQQQQTVNRPKAPPAPPAPRPRKHSPRRESPREKRTRLVLTFSVSLLILFGLYLFINMANAQAMLVQEQENASQALRLQTFEKQVVNLFAHGKKREGFSLLRNYLTAYPGWKKGQTLYRTYAGKELKAASELVKARSYSKAVDHIQFMKGVVLESNLRDTLNFLLSDLHVAQGEFQKAINLLSSLESSNRFDYRADYKIARILEEKLDNPLLASYHYETVMKKTEDYYSSRFGAAYWLIPKSIELPDKHYEVYLNKGKNDFTLEDYEDAIIAINWAIFIREYEAEPYFFKGLSYLELNRPEKACAAWLKADTMALPSVQITDLLAKHCP